MAKLFTDFITLGPKRWRAVTAYKAKHIPANVGQVLRSRSRELVNHTESGSQTSVVNNAAWRVIMFALESRMITKGRLP